LERLGDCNNLVSTVKLLKRGGDNLGEKAMLLSDPSPKAFVKVVQEIERQRIDAIVAKMRES
jgi:hypothetical protein